MIDFVTVTGLFFEGLLSFLSPCILPLVPLYIGYLSTSVENKSNKKVQLMIVTNCFVLGICSVFFIMAIGVSSIKQLILEYQNYIGFLGGIILIVFGLMNLGFIKSRLNKTFKINSQRVKNNYLNAFLLGFFFSFAWTPCIGPYLSNVIFMSATSSGLTSYLLILAYALGFVIPFLLIGLFTDFSLKLIKNNMGILKWTVKIGGAIILVMGLWMTYDNGSKIINTVKNQQQVQGDYIPILPFELYDQNGLIQSSNDYLDKPLIIQFVTSWCQYCKQSIPELNQFSIDNPDINALIMVAPGQNDISSTEMIEYFKEYDLSIPVLFDLDGEQFKYYGINSYPTTFFVEPKGIVYGYQPGLLKQDNLKQIMNLMKTN